MADLWIQKLQRAVRGVGGGGRMKGISKENQERLLDTNNNVVIARKGVGEVEGSKGWVNGDGRRLNLEW